MRRLPIRTVGACAAVLALAITVRGQNPPPVYRGGVDVVHVDVSVLDKNRKPVRGLTAKDFTVLEDGKPREIVAFAAVDLPPAPVVATATAPWMREVAPDVTTNAIGAEGRLVTIMFDWSIRFEDQPEARRIARAAVDAMGPGDLGAVVFVSGFANEGTVQNFTADKARLLEAISRPIMPAIVGSVPISPNGKMFESTTYLFDADGSTSPNCFCRLCAYDKVEDVADAIGAVSNRRKSILFIGTYFPPPQAPPKSNCSDHWRMARDAITVKLGLANATIHVIDPSGGAPPGAGPVPIDHDEAIRVGLGPSAPIERERHAQLPFLANLTGGRTVMSDNNPELVVPAIFEESSAYYTLAFPAASATRAKDGINRIQVKVARKDVDVQARSGYQVTKTAAAIKAEAKIPPVARTVAATLPRTDLPLTISALPLAMPGRTDTVTVAVMLRTPPASAPRAPASPASEEHVDTAIIVLDTQGRIVGSKTQSADIPWAPGWTYPDEYELLARFDLKPGRYEIRGASDVRNGPGGSVYGFVEVPDFAKDDLALSGIALSVAPTRMSAPKDLFADLLPIVPTARREFLTTDEVTAFVRVYRNGKTPPPGVTARILDSTGRVVFEDNQAAPPADYQVDLPVGRLQAGEYLLEITAASGEHTATRSLRFSVH